MRPYDDPTVMTADERLREIAAILAAGILRLRSRAALLADSGRATSRENSPDCGQDCLEVSTETVLSVHTG